MITPRFNPPKEWMDSYNQYTYGFCNLMLKLCRMRVKGKALEIGSYSGDTAALMGMFHLFDEIHCVEPFEGEEEFLERNPLDSWWQVEQEFSLNTRYYPVTLHKGYSYDILPTLTEKFNFIYIDGAHDYDSVKQDIQLCLPLLAKGGIIAGHDYQQEHGGVQKAVDELLGKPTHCFEDESWMILTRK
tara:strand:+ start:1780 stop:2340 length:561 start_codon:yes stop_codon:yes gene_type:complete